MAKTIMVRRKERWIIMLFLCFCRCRLAFKFASNAFCERAGREVKRCCSELAVVGVVVVLCSTFVEGFIVVSYFVSCFDTPTTNSVTPKTI